NTKVQSRLNTTQRDNSSQRVIVGRSAVRCRPPRKFVQKAEPYEHRRRIRCPGTALPAAIEKRNAPRCDRSAAAHSGMENRKCFCHRTRQGISWPFRRGSQRLSGASNPHRNSCCSPSHSHDRRHGHRRLLILTIKVPTWLCFACLIHWPVVYSNR